MESLDPRQIEAFQAVVETGSATLAAERLRMTQPNVTRIIASLEAGTGLALFERGRFGMRLTAAGELFAEEVRRSFAGLGRIAAVAAAVREGRHGRVVVAAVPAYGEGFVTEALGAFAGATPDLSVRIDLVNAEEAVRKVLHGEADIGVMAGSISGHARLHSRILGQRRFLAVMPSDHALANRDSVSIEDLGRIGIIHYSPLNPLRAVVEQTFVRMTTPVRHRVEATTQRVALKLAAHGVGIALVELDSFRDVVDQYPDLRALPVEDAPVWDVSMVWARGRAPSPVVVAALDRIAASAERQAER